MRPKVVAECTLKESAAINQILGRKVRPLKLGFGDCSCSDYFSGTLSQEKNRLNIMNRLVQPSTHVTVLTVDSFILDLFKARKERQLHMQMYPGWSARDNYAQSKEVNIITGYNNY